MRWGEVRFWIHFEYRIADGLNVAGERKRGIRDDSKIYGLNNGKKMEQPITKMGMTGGGEFLTLNHHIRHYTRLLSRSTSGSWEEERDEEHLPVPGTVPGVLYIVVGRIVRRTPKILALV